MIKTVCDIADPLSDDNIARAINKAKKYGLNIKTLEHAIEKLQDRLLDE